MNFLQNILDNTQLPVLYAFILGLMTAISPCPLATNITATAYISKDIENRRKAFMNGLIYTLGRAITYTSIGIILYFGASKFEISKLFQSYGPLLLGPFLVIFGILMLDVIRFNLPGVGNLSERIAGSGKKGSGWVALFLGIVFALAFCPYSGVLYFGMLIPLTIGSAKGLVLPLVFAIATGIPVILISWFIAYSVSGIGNFYHKIKSFEKWFRRVIAVIFIAAGIYYIAIYFIWP
jgi:cytochrome c-type biogenesis protein